MEKVKDLYGLLEVEQDATSKEIKKAFRKLAAKHHPDVSKEENAKEKFKDIYEAYDVLMDKDARKEYDEFVDNYKKAKGMTFKDFEKIIAKQGTFAGAHTPVVGEDVELVIPFTVSQIKQGMKKNISFDRYENCSTCKGHGFIRKSENVCGHCKGKGFTQDIVQTPFGDVVEENKCDACHGKGYSKALDCETCKGAKTRPVNVTLMLTFPEQTTHNYVYRVRYRGDDGKNSGRNGDLLLQFKQEDKDPFKIKDRINLETAADVSYLTTLTGGTSDFKLPTGEIMKLPIERNSKQGHQIIIPDEGLHNGKIYGILTIKLNVTLPESLTTNSIKKIVEALS